MIQKTKFKVTIEVHAEIETTKDANNQPIKNVNVKGYGLGLEENKLLGEGWYKKQKLTPLGAKTIITSLSNAIVAGTVTFDKDKLVEAEELVTTANIIMQNGLGPYLQKKQEAKPKILTEKDMMKQPFGLSFIKGKA